MITLKFFTSEVNVSPAATNSAYTSKSPSVAEVKLLPAISVLSTKNVASSDTSSPDPLINEKSTS